VAEKLAGEDTVLWTREDMKMFRENESTSRMTQIVIIAMKPADDHLKPVDDHT